MLLEIWFYTSLSPSSKPISDDTFAYLCWGHERYLPWNSHLTPPKNSTPPVVFLVFFLCLFISGFFMSIEHRPGWVRFGNPGVQTEAAKNELFDLKSRAQRKYRAPKAHRDLHEARDVKQQREELMRADGWELVGWLTRKLTYLLHGKFGKASTQVCARLGMGYVIVHRRVVTGSCFGVDFEKD